MKAIRFILAICFLSALVFAQGSPGLQLLESWNFSSHSDAIVRLAFSSDGHLMASSSGGDKNVIVWDRKTKQGLFTFNTLADYSRLLFAQDNTMLMTILESQVLIWDLKTGKQNSSIEEVDPILARQIVGFDNHTLWFAQQTPLRLINAMPAKWSLRAALQKQPGTLLKCSSLKLSQVGDSCQSTFGQLQPFGSLVVYNTKLGLEIRDLQGGFKFFTAKDKLFLEAENALPTWSNNGQFITLEAAQEATLVVDIKDQSVRVLDGVFLNSSLDGLRLYSYFNENVLVFNRSGHELAALPNPRYEKTEYNRTPAAFWFLGLISDAENELTLMYSAQNILHAKTIDQQFQLLNAEQFGGHNVGAFAISPDGRLLATAGSTQSLEILELSTGKVLRRYALSKYVETVYALAFSQDQKFIFVGHALNRSYISSYTFTMPIYKINLATAEQTRLVADDSHLGFVRSMAVSPDGSRLAVGYSNSQVAILDLTTEKTICTLRPSGAFTRGFVMGLAWRPDGLQIASSMGDGLVRIWNPDTGKRLHVLTGHVGFVRSIAYSKNGKTLVSAGQDGDLRVWDLSTRTSRVLKSHQGAVTSVALLEQTLFSAGTDGSIRAWDLSTAQEILNQNDASNAVLDLQISSDQKNLYSFARDNTLRHYALTGITGGLK